MCKATIYEAYSKLIVCGLDLIFISNGDKATMPSAVKALHWLPSLPVTGFIYSMAGITTVTSDKHSKYTHMLVHTHTQADHLCQRSGVVRGSNKVNAQELRVVYAGLIKWL